MPLQLPPAFTHLEVHSYYTLLGATASPLDLVERAKALRMNALALTDHGNLFGAMEDMKYLAGMLAGEFTRFDVFKGPITDNQGNVILEDGVSLEQADLDGFAQFGSECKTCMYWWNENITAELPELE